MTEAGRIAVRKSGHRESVNRSQSSDFSLVPICRDIVGGDDAKYKRIRYDVRWSATSPVPYLRRIASPHCN